MRERVVCLDKRPGVGSRFPRNAQTNQRWAVLVNRRTTFEIGKHRQARGLTQLSLQHGRPLWTATNTHSRLTLKNNNKIKRRHRLRFLAGRETAGLVVVVGQHCGEEEVYDVAGTASRRRSHAHTHTTAHNQNTSRFYSKVRPDHGDALTEYRCSRGNSVDGSPQLHSGCAKFIVPFATSDRGKHRRGEKKKTAQRRTHTHTRTGRALTHA